MWNIEFINILNIGEPRATANRLLETCDGHRLAGSNHFDSPVRQVADPASDRQLLGLPRDIPAEPDTLHSAANEEPHRHVASGHPTPPVRFLDFRT